MEGVDATLWLQFWLEASARSVHQLLELLSEIFVRSTQFNQHPLSHTLLCSESSMVYTNPLCLPRTLQNGCTKISVGISNLLNIEVDMESIDILIIMIIDIQELSIILHLSQFLCVYQ